MNATLNSKHPADEQQSPQHTIIVAYHEDDRALFESLLPHLNMLIRHQSDQHWYQYRYPLSEYESAKELRKKHLDQVEAASVFLPLTSAALVDVLWGYTLKYPRMAAALTRVSVIPIALRPAANVRALSNKALEEYPAGPEREHACIKLMQSLEKRLDKICGRPPQTPAHQTMLASVQIHFSEK